MRSVLFLYLFVCLLTCSCGGAEVKRDTSGPSSVWEVTKDGKVFYLAGTIHLLRKEDFPLPNVFEQAYKRSQQLVFELPPGSDMHPATLQLIQKLGYYEDGRTLDKEVSAETYERVKTWAKAKRQSLDNLRRLKPWFLALNISVTEYQSLGADASRGVDNFYEQRGANDGKASEGLETVEDQLSLFAKLDAKLQEEMLNQTMKEVELLAKDFPALISAWRSGDHVKVHEYMYREADKHPELMEAFLGKRNRAWMKRLMELFDEAHPSMVLVGAGHIGGEDGLISLLEAQGCKVTQFQPVAP